MLQQWASQQKQVWLGQAVVALGALEAWQWGLKLLVEVVEVEGLQPVFLPLGREQLWQQQLLSGV